MDYSGEGLNTLAHLPQRQISSSVRLVITWDSSCKKKIKAGHENGRVNLLLIVFHARLFGGVSLCGH